MRKLIRLAIAGALLMVALAAPRAATAHHAGECEYWYDAWGNCYYSCPGHGDGYC